MRWPWTSSETDPRHVRASEETLDRLDDAISRLERVRDDLRRETDERHNGR